MYDNSAILLSMKLNNQGGFKMCEAASGITTKDSVFISKISNSHTVILEESGIKDIKSVPDFVKWEIIPKDRDYTTPMSTWIYRVDQDTIPSWYVPKVDEKRARKALKEWAKYHNITKEFGNNVCEQFGDLVFLKAGYGATLKAGDSATLKAGDGATLTAGYGATLKAGNRATLTAGDGATLTAGDSATLKAGDGATLTAGYGATLTAGDGATLTADDSATLTAGYGATLTAGNRATLKAGDSATLTAGYGSVIVILWYDGEWKVITKTIIKEESGKTFKFENGEFKEVK
jgi:hypothetical protein